MHLLTQSNYIVNVSVAVTTTIIREDNTAIRRCLSCHAHITILRVPLQHLPIVGGRCAINSSVLRGNANYSDVHDTSDTL